MNWETITHTLIHYATLYGIKAIIALAIFVVGKWLSKKLVKITKSLMTKAKIDETLVNFSGNILYSLALVFVIIAALSQLGIETTSLVAIIAAAGLAIGLSLQDSLSNLASGVMIILFRPFKIGDFVEAGGIAGTVENISIFTTDFKTADNRLIIVPNGKITAGNITNASAKPERRIDLTIGVSYNDDLKKVKDVLAKIVAADERILKDKDVIIAVSELADSSVNLVVRPWVKTEDYWNVRFDLTETIKTTFDTEGISIPFPQRDLHIVEGSAVKKNKAA
ncbi:MAG: mechanosensitive ion channel [Alphaproteobacteria bacterium]|nr:mechanosensitive ion channel [Alphaproteobacteria bacterium]